jgi:hypothetical protein
MGLENEPPAVKKKHRLLGRPFRAMLRLYNITGPSAKYFFLDLMPLEDIGGRFGFAPALIFFQIGS